MFRKLTFSGCLAIFFALANPGWAKDSNQYEELFVIASTFAPSTLDPHATDQVANHTLSSYIFDPLFKLDSKGKITSDLIKKADVVKDLLWQFTLHKNIRFHDGAELTAEDVVASIQRLQKRLKNSLVYSRSMFQVTGRYSFIASTQEVISDLPKKLATAFIIKKSATLASQQAFDSGIMAIGTGPYRLLKHEGMDTFEFKAFEAYHSDQPYVQQVRVKFNLSRKERLQQFIKGEADLIDLLNDEEMEAIQSARQANFSIPPGHSLYLLVPDVFRNQSPYISDHTGKPLKQNPLKNINVRRAISKAIDRTAFIKQFYGRTATASGQLQAIGGQGYSNKITVDTQDIATANALLKEAGYPNGFRITLHDRDSRRPHLLAIAAMLNKTNIDTRIETFPGKVFFNQLDNHHYSLPGFFYSEDGDLGAMLRNLVFSKSPINTGRYQNDKTDQLILRANREFNTTARTRQYRYINELVMEDLAVIPILFSSTIWAIRPDFTYELPGSDYTEAYQVKPGHKLLNTIGDTSVE